MASANSTSCLSPARPPIINARPWPATHFRIGKDIYANFELTYADATNDYIVAALNASNGAPNTATSIWYNVIGQKMVGPFSYPKLPVRHPSNPYTVPTEYRARLMDTGDGFNFNSTDSKQ